MIAGDLIPPRLVAGAGDVYKLRHGHADHEELPDLFLERELLEGLLCPFGTVIIEMDGPGLLNLASGEKGRKCQKKCRDREQPSHHEATIPEMPQRPSVNP